MTKAFANILFEHETLYAVIDKVEESFDKKMANVENILENNDKDSLVQTKKNEEENAHQNSIVSESKLSSNTPEVIISKTENSGKKIVQAANLIVIVRDFSPEKREFLANILSALKKNIDDIPVYDLNNIENINIKEIISQTKALFSFGVPFTSLGFKTDLTHYILKMAQEKHYLMADDLLIVKANINNEKRMLWEALKGIF